MPPHQPRSGEVSPLATPIDPSRRKVLLGMAAAGVAAIGGGVVACSSDEPSATQPDDTSSASTTAEPPTNPDGSEGPSETATAEAPPEGIASTADIPVGGGEIFEDERVVITQPTAGEFRAFSAICTHQGCTVASVRDGVISCPCHGSQYRVDDGSVVRGPAPAGLAPREITIENGSIILG